MTRRAGAPRVVGVEEVAAYLGCSPRFVRQLCESEALPATKIGKGRRSTWALDAALIEADECSSRGTE